MLRALYHTERLEHPPFRVPTCASAPLRALLHGRVCVAYAYGQSLVNMGECMSTTQPHVFKQSQPVTEKDVIPVLDLGPFLAGEPGALESLGQEVCRALEDIGFFFIKNLFSS